MAECGFFGVLSAFLCVPGLDFSGNLVLSFVNKHWYSKEHFQLEHDEKIKLSESLRDILHSPSLIFRFDTLKLHLSPDTFSLG